VVDKSLQEHLKQAEVAKGEAIRNNSGRRSPAPRGAAASEEAPAKTIAQMASPAIQFLVEGDILLLPLGLPPSRKRSRYGAS